MREIIVLLALVYYLLELIAVTFQLNFFAWLFALFIQLFNRQKSWWEKIRKWAVLSTHLFKLLGKNFRIWLSLNLLEHCDITCWRQRRSILIWILSRNLLLNIWSRYLLLNCNRPARNNLIDRTLLLWANQMSTRLCFDQHATHRLQSLILWLNLRRKLNILNFWSLMGYDSWSNCLITD